MISDLNKLDKDGFLIQENVLSKSEVTSLINSFAGTSQAGTRNLFTVPQIQSLARSTPIRELVEAVLGKNCFAVRAILFDKTPEVNWKVAWHQDLTIAVKSQKEVPEYHPWSIKDDIVHVQPPNVILKQMVTLRIHLDDCNSENGPLRVIPGSHRYEKLSSEQIQSLRSKTPEVACFVASGGVLVMKPLLLHASSKADSPNHRRVIHLEYAATELARGLEWYDKIF